MIDRYKWFKETYISTAGLDNQDCWLVFFAAIEECFQRAAMFFRCVQQNWLVHGDSYWQPGPNSQQLKNAYNYGTILIFFLAFYLPYTFTTMLP
jgi:hypothetical protein